VRQQGKEYIGVFLSLFFKESAFKNNLLSDKNEYLHQFFSDKVKGLPL